MPSSIWIRQHPRGPLEELTLPWHLRGEAPANVAARGLIAGVCGTTFTDPAAVDTMDDEPDLGDRCPVCHAAYEDPD